MGEVLPRFKTRFSEYRLVPERGGHFEISVDGKLLYSKLKTGEFPTNAEVVRLLEEELRARK